MKINILLVMFSIEHNVTRYDDWRLRNIISELLKTLKGYEMNRYGGVLRVKVTGF